MFNKIKVVDKNRVFKIKEICELLKIDVPSECSSIKNRYVTDTFLIDKLETKNEIIENVKKCKNYSDKYYEKINSKAKNFKKCYFEKSENVKNADFELLQFFIQYLYVFSNLKFTTHEYMKFELYNKTLKQTEEDIIFAFKNNRIFKIKELCSLLEIDIPNEYIETENNYVTDTVLMDKLETKEEICANVKKRENFSAKYYNGVNKKAQKLKRRYFETSENTEHTDSQLLQFFIEYLYVFQLLNFTVRDYIKCELFNLTIKQAKKDIIKAYRNNRVFTIAQICELLKIDVPCEYIGVKDNYVTDTVLMDKLETKDQILKSVRNNKDYSENYYELTNTRAEKFKEAYSNDVSEYNNHTNLQLLQLFVEYLYVFSPLKYTYTDYFNIELYHRTVEEADAFINLNYRIKVIPEILNNQSYIMIFDNKVIFNKTFSKYVNRKWLYVKTATLKQFEEFTNENPVFIGKIVDGSLGEGVRIFEVNNNNNIELFDECYKADMIIEQLLVNHKSISEFNESCLNTIRVCTLLIEDNKPIITLAGIRMGKAGKVVDNHHDGGVLSIIDVDTGIITTDGMDVDHKYYDKHPDSLKTIKGFQIPDWEKVKSFVKELALVVPQARSVGWDIAITTDGSIEVIEGNFKVDLRMMQLPDQIGKKHMYKKYVEKKLDSR